ncbi:type IV pilus assembly protein FimV [Luteimonas sp. A537]
MMRAIRWAAMCGVLLALFAGQVLALGLGRIEVKSRAGQPLLAEIQVISNDSAELDQLRAGLASPDTFRRIGLPAPDSVVAGLEFRVALDARGEPVIRVTTREPVTQPMLTFLVEVDWGQGRLVREYSALVDAPQTVAAPAQPVIEAPVAAPANTVLRAPEAAAVPAGAAASADEADATDDAVAADGAVADEDGAVAERADAATADEPAPTAAIAPAPVATQAPMPAAPPAQASTPSGEYGPVQAGETLGAIAARLVGDGVTREQAIVALFRANPEAFIASNLNLVRQGAVLRIPDRSEIAGLDLRESRALMREQVAAWRDMTSPAPQPDVADVATADAAPAQAGEGEAETQPATVARTADARLEIVPPSAVGGLQAGIRSGIQAGGEGEMLRQEMQQELHQSQETLAAREAEVDELKARVADLERLQAQQAQLITMKDSELAAVQERLATSSEPAAEPPPPAATEAGGLPWVWIGLALLLVAAVAWLLIRRAPKATPRPRFDASTLAAESSSPAEGESLADAPQQVRAAPLPATPAWHAGAAGTDAAVPVAQVAPERVPARAGTDISTGTGTDVDADDAAVIASLNPAPGGAERIELARAYLDLGDVATARDLLQEVVDAGDHAARAEASRLLEGIA